MKKLTLIITLAFIVSASAFSQTQPQMKLPETVKFVLTKKQFLHLDSCINFALNSIDSKQSTNYIATGISPLYQQLQLQLVIDSSTIVKPVKAPDKSAKKQ